LDLGSEFFGINFMACLTLSNGAFDLRTFVTTNANAGQVTITRTAAPEKIVVEHSAFTNDFVLNGGPNTVFSSILFGSGAKQYVAILSIDTSTNFASTTSTTAPPPTSPRLPFPPPQPPVCHHSVPSLVAHRQQNTLPQEYQHVCVYDL
jgi:hypothetical protein